MSGPKFSSGRRYQLLSLGLSLHMQQWTCVGAGKQIWAVWFKHVSEKPHAVAHICTCSWIWWLHCNRKI